MSEKRVINLLQLYPRDMNIYGDWGNALVLMRRLQWHGYHVNLLSYNVGDEFPEAVDLIVGGGGQDSGQAKIGDDLLKIGPKLIDLAEDDVPMLMICGLYQQYGHFFKTKDGQVIQGIGLLDIETYGGEERMIGNIVSESDEFGTIVGYENHSGSTVLGAKAQPFGRVIRGAGNNGKDETEGARYRHVIGTYMHGSILPKNPAVADYLIEKAVMRKFGIYHPQVIDDHIAETARETAVTRPR
ncbi:MAG TPA: glutamine amidotransferase [Candidatus Saccharimonas sp.]|jgi:CobQ-like glutamine amidotransferase family enzyme|nr:glutamine amidotransferase [Candidatus Saccharimonas sp.]